MKNMKVSAKLILSFLIVIFLAVIVGVVGIIGMTQINSGSAELYERQTIPLLDLAQARETFQLQRVTLREIALARRDDARLDTLRADVVRDTGAFLSYMDLYRPTIIAPEALRQFDSVIDTYNEFHDVMLYAIDRSRTAESSSEIVAIINDAGPLADYVQTNLLDLGNARAAQASETFASNNTMSTTMLTVIIAVLAVAIVAALFLALYISRLFARPLNDIAAFMEKASSKGDLSLTEKDEQNISVIGAYKDEIGRTMKGVGAFIAQMTKMAEELSVIAGGDLTREVTPLSEKDTMGNAMQNLLGNLNSMFGEINTATTQVASGSKQIADGSQTLAQGSTEQAASVQQLSSSISEIAQKTKGNADMAGKAAALANNIKGSAEKGNRQMDEMMSAVKDINASSQNISKVIKSIDDIAFQTNILALNAAVEAARAGQHGKGFAVVAEEVRNLAAKSAAAAKDTESLIADSIEKAELGSKIADETAASLVEIVSGIEESSRLVSDIATSSEEQSVGITQINSGVDQVAQVVQQNSATAEESAAAAQEMSGQSDMLEQLISQFKIKGSGGIGRIAASAAAAASAAESLPVPAETAEFDDGFGKY